MFLPKSVLLCIPEVPGIKPPRPKLKNILITISKLGTYKIIKLNYINLKKKLSRLLVKNQIL